MTRIIIITRRESHKVDWQPAYAIYPSPSFSTRFDEKVLLFLSTPFFSLLVFIFSVSSSNTARACPLFRSVYTLHIHAGCFFLFCLGREETRKKTLELSLFLDPPSDGDETFLCQEHTLTCFSLVFFSSSSSLVPLWIVHSIYTHR